MINKQQRKDMIMSELMRVADEAMKNDPQTVLPMVVSRICDILVEIEDVIDDIGAILSDSIQIQPKQTKEIDGPTKD